MRTRRIIQTIFFLSTLYIGFGFVRYIRLLESGVTDAVKPGGVEAFLPISALMALKRLLATGEYDYIHPAGLSLFIIFLFISLVFKKSFCGYVCPVGFISELVSAGGLNRRLGSKLSWFFSLPKYLLFAFFAYMVLFAMSVDQIGAFLGSPYNKIADAKMLGFFHSPSGLTLVVISAVMLLSFAVRGIWCRFLCPYGVLQFIAGIFSPFAVKRNILSCTNCMKCTEACPAGINVHLKTTVMHPDCIGCHDCVRARSSESCIGVRKNINVNRIGLVILISVFLMIFVAMAAGKWQSSLSGEEYLLWYGKKEMLSH